eukprot:scaffold3429_cov339-Prasinococcus_capsulatus_cf.AAC.5
MGSLAHSRTDWPMVGWLDGGAPRRRCSPPPACGRRSGWADGRSRRSSNVSSRAASRRRPPLPALARGASRGAAC